MGLIEISKDGFVIDLEKAKERLDRMDSKRWQNVKTLLGIEGADGLFPQTPETRSPQRKKNVTIKN